MTYLKFNKTKLVNLEYSLKREVIRTNNLGAYACTTIIDCNTRKYHGLLVCPIPEFGGQKHVLVSALHETIIQHNSSFNLGLHKYAGDNYEPKGHKYIQDFSSNPIPKLVYRVGGVILTKEIILAENENRILIRYKLEEAISDTIIRFKPFLAFRNIHALSKANMDVDHRFEETENGIVSCLYQGYPKLFIQFSKENEFTPAPDWYYNIEYKQEQKRGYDYKEDLYVSGFFEMRIKKGESIIFSAGLTSINPKTLTRKFNSEVSKRIPRDNFNNCLQNTIKQFFINKEKQTLIIAGLPWLPIRSRDAFIAMPGLALPRKDKKFFKHLINSMLVHFNGHKIPEFIEDTINPVYTPDTPLWFIWTLQQYKKFFPEDDVWKIYGKQVLKIINGYLNEIEIWALDKNGLLYVSELHSHNSWMHASYDGKPLLQRHGFLVELQALWYNAICFTLKHQTFIRNKRWVINLQLLEARIRKSFQEIFWDKSLCYLADFATFTQTNFQMRPNQLFALSLPYSPLEAPQIKSTLDAIKNQLLTQVGLRTLSPADPMYQPKYRGNHQERELAAYNGTAWPWLFTHYFDALYKVYPKSALRAAQKFLQHMEPEIQINGICSLSELYHGDPPHKAKGAISFAMNTAELIRLKNLLAEDLIIKSTGLS